MAQQTTGTGDNTKDKLRDMADAAGEKLKETTANAQEMAGNVAEQAREYAAQAKDLTQDLTALLEKSVKDKPMQTLAVVAALAFVIGALWKK